MKKILMGSFVLTALSLSIIAFQLSCSKTANAQTGSTTGITQLGKIVYTTQSATSVNFGIWIANYDGSNKKQVQIALPTGLTIYNDGTKISPDGKTIFLTGIQSGKSYNSIYSCGVDGSNLTKIVDSCYGGQINSAN